MLLSQKKVIRKGFALSKQGVENIKFPMHRSDWKHLVSCKKTLHSYFRLLKHPFYESHCSVDHSTYKINTAAKIETNTWVLFFRYLSRWSVLELKCTIRHTNKPVMTNATTIKKPKHTRSFLSLWECQVTILSVLSSGKKANVLPL